jgi:hypothetical protein
MEEIINIFMKKVRNKKNTPHEIKERKLLSTESVKYHS